MENVELDKNLQEALEWISDMEHIGFFKLTPDEIRSLLIIRQHPTLHTVLRQWGLEASYLNNSFNQIVQSFKHMNPLTRDEDILNKIKERTTNVA